MTEETIEERLLETLATKQELATAALDADSDVSEVAMQSGIEELRRRVEKLLGKAPEAPLDCSLRNRVEEQTLQLAERRDRVASAGGQLVGAALQLVGELVSAPDQSPPDAGLVSRLRTGLEQSVERDAHGRVHLRVALPDESSLQQLATMLAQLLVNADP